MPETKCDICKRWFNVTTDKLKMETATVIDKTGSNRLQITSVTCPLCGKTYPVVVDDAETIKLRLEVESLLRKRLKYVQEHHPVPFRLAAKIGKLNGKSHLAYIGQSVRIRGANVRKLLQRGIPLTIFRKPFFVV